jgi:hypothetical protein
MRSTTTDGTLGEAAEAIITAGRSGDEAIDAVLAHLGFTRADLPRLRPGRRKRLLAHLHTWLVNEDITSDELARSRRDGSVTANEASRLLGKVHGLVERGGLPEGEDPRGRAIIAVTDLALALADLDADADDAVRQILTHLGVEPDRVDRLRTAPQRRCHDLLKGAAWILDRDRYTTTLSEAALIRSATAHRFVTAADSLVERRTRPGR